MAQPLQSPLAVADRGAHIAGWIASFQEYDMNQNNQQNNQDQKRNDPQNQRGQQDKPAQGSAQGHAQDPKKPGQQQGQDDGQKRDPRGGQQNTNDDERGEPGTQRPGQGVTDRTGNRDQ